MTQLLITRTKKEIKGSWHLTPSEKPFPFPSEKIHVPPHH